MEAVMAQSTRDAWIMSAVWAGLVVGFAAITMKIMKPMKAMKEPATKEHHAIPS
jgi:hypothetical protein